MLKQITYGAGKAFGSLPRPARWIVVVFLVGLTVFLVGRSDPPLPPKAPEQIAAEQKQAEIRAAEQAKLEAKKKKDDSDLALVVAAVRQLKRNMRDPDSFVLVNAVKIDEVVCIEYRAKNGFGGYTSEPTVFNMKTMSLPVGQTGITEFNKRCAQKSGEDLTSTINYYLK